MLYSLATQTRELREAPKCMQTSLWFIHNSVFKVERLASKKVFFTDKGIYSTVGDRMSALKSRPADYRAATQAYLETDL